MNKQRVKSSCVIVLACVSVLGSILYPSLCSGQNTAAAFLKDDHSPAAYAMGMSDVVTSMGAQASGGNPALLGMMSKRFELFSSYANLIDGAQYGHLAAALALNPHGLMPLDGLGLAVTRLGIGGFSGTDGQGNPTGSFGSEDLAVALSASGNLGRQMRLGVTGKAIRESLAGYQSNTALAADIGMSYAMPQIRGLLVGLSVNNLGQGIRFVDQTDPLPLSASAGISAPFGPALAVMTVNRMIHEQRTEIGAGVSAGLGPVNFRAGYTAQKGTGTNLAARDQSGFAQMVGGLSGGMGILLGQNARVDYAISEGAAELGTNQRVSLTLGWGDRSSQSVKSVNRNTRIMQQNTWQDSNSDAVDWHMINQQPEGSSK